MAVSSFCILVHLQFFLCFSPGGPGQWQGPVSDIFDGEEDQLRPEIGLNPAGVQQHDAVPDLREVLLYLVAFKLGILFENIVEKASGAPANPTGLFLWSKGAFLPSPPGLHGSVV